MDAILLRIGEKDANGYPLSLYIGEESSVLARADNDENPDESSSIPLDFAKSLSVTDMQCVTANDTRAILSAADPSNNLLRELGVNLYALLNRDSVGKRWKTARVKAKAAKGAAGVVQLRTYLDVRDEELARMPWELLYDVDEGLAIAKLGLERPIVRYAKNAVKDAGDAEDESELRVLFVIGCNPEETAVEWLAELRSFLELVCPQRNVIDFEIFEAHAQVSPRKLLPSLHAAIGEFRPHILHFVGHGRIEDGEGALELYDPETKNNKPWTAEDFNEDLLQSPPRLVLLNACRTSTQAADTDAPIRVLASMSSCALSAGSRAVISMQHDISGQAAAQFSRSFYSALLRKLPIDVAVTKARIDVSKLIDAKDRNWALPVCTLSVTPETVLPPLKLFQDARQKNVLVHPELSSLSKYVDRRMERRVLLQWEHDKEKNVTFLTSDDSMGKSSLAKLISEWRLLKGHQVIYVNCAAQKKVLDSVEFLRYIRGTIDAAPDLLRPNLYQEFAFFNSTLNAVLAGKPVQADKGTGIDENLPQDRNKFSGQDTWNQIFLAFTQDLKNIAKVRPVTLVIDHLTKGNTKHVDPNDFKEHFVKLFLEPQNADPSENISVIIVATGIAVEGYGLGPLAKRNTIAKLDLFPSENWSLLVREYSVREELDAKVAEEALQWVGSARNAPWDPKKLDVYRIFYEEKLENSKRPAVT
ncbi:MAG: CHAT domain-containing protein [Gemmatimonadaceae bacterium]